MFTKIVASYLIKLFFFCFFFSSTINSHWIFNLYLPRQIFFPIFFLAYFPISSIAYNLENLIIYFSLRSFVCAQVSQPLKEKLNYTKMFSWSKIPSKKVHGFTNSVLCCSSQFSSQLTRFLSRVLAPNFFKHWRNDGYDALWLFLAAACGRVEAEDGWKST